MSKIDLDSFIQHVENRGYGFDASSKTPHPELRVEVMDRFESQCKEHIAAWARDEVGCTLIPDQLDDGPISYDAEWGGCEPGHRFKVQVHGMALEDLWWMLNEHVVYSDYVERDVSSGYKNGPRYSTQSFSLEIYAQVMSAEQVDGGLIVEMIISSFKDEDAGMSWGEWVEGGFADWDSDRFTGGEEWH